jgi:hypothetical protein
MIMPQDAKDMLIQLILPKGILSYFDVTKIEQSNERISIYLDELNVIPEEYSKEKLISKGFFPETSIQDFPVRGKAVYLFVKRRRWLNTTTEQIVTRNWELVSEGTRMTKEFAAFLKELSRYRPGKL